MLEIAALAFNKIVLLFFYNIKHLKFQSSNTIDHWSNKNTHIDYWVVRMQYQKSFFLHIIQLVGYILTVCCRIFQSKPKNPRGLLIFLSEYMLYQSELQSLYRQIVILSIMNYQNHVHQLFEIILSTFQCMCFAYWYIPHFGE